MRSIVLHGLLALTCAAELDEKELIQLRTEGYELSQKKEFAKAEEKFLRLREAAVRFGNREHAVYALTALAGCKHASFLYREALQLHEQALQEAKNAGLKEREATALIAIVSLLTSLGENSQALQYVKQIPIHGNNLPQEARLDWFNIQIQLFSRVKQIRPFEYAAALALEEAARPAPARVVAAMGNRYAKLPEAAAEIRRATVFDYLSDGWLEFEDKELALRYAQEAFRIRATYGHPERLRSLLQMCSLERKRGNFRGALTITEAALHGQGFLRTPMQLFRLRRERGLALIGLQRVTEGLQELEFALRYPRAWRSEVLPTDSGFLQFESYLNGQIQLEFLDAIKILPPERIDAALAAESFWIAEEGRFASLRAASFPRDEISKRLGKGYWPLLKEFQTLQARVLAGEVSLAARRDSLETKLDEMERAASLKIPHAGKLPLSGFREWQRSIPPDETIFAYHFSEPNSLAWAVTRDRIELKKIEGKTEIQKASSEFLAALRQKEHKKRSSIGYSLTKHFFREFSYPYRTNPFWTVVVDDTMSLLPLSALPSTLDPSRFLVETQTLRQVPSAVYALGDAPERWSKVAVGIADPIYNSLDERLKRSGDAVKPNKALEMNRLPGTLLEAEKAMQALKVANWNTRISSGLEATPTAMREMSRQRADIVHVATHFSLDPQRPDLLAISLTSDVAPGQIALFSAPDLAAQRTVAKLVTLSGCASATGKAFPGVALSGLTRAWLVSGARNVLGTVWAVEDNAGPLFPLLYGKLSGTTFSSRGVASALRSTQMELIGRRDRYSDPGYWSAYVLLQRS